MIHTGDCVEVMAGMEPASVDAIVTDPPYDLTGGQDAIEKFEIDGRSHHVGDPNCFACWTNPAPLHEGCPSDPPGLMHDQFGDENSDGDYWLFTRCDACGEPKA